LSREHHAGHKHELPLLPLTGNHRILLPRPLRLFSPALQLGLGRQNRWAQVVPPLTNIKALIDDRVPSEAQYPLMRVVHSEIATWLEKRGVVMLTMARTTIQNEQRFRLTQADDETVHLGRMLGADLVVSYTVDSSVSLVTVEAVQVETGVIAWSGTAVTAMNHEAEAIRALTCHALATAWGMESPGRYYLYRSDVC